MKHNPNLIETYLIMEKYKIHILNSLHQFTITSCSKNKKFKKKKTQNGKFNIENLTLHKPHTIPQEHNIAGNKELPIICLTQIVSHHNRLCPNRRLLTKASKQDYFKDSLSLRTLETLWSLLAAYVKEQAKGNWDIKVNTKNICFKGSAKANRGFKVG